MWRSFVAMGDSFTEGIDDPYPEPGRYRGWADLVAARLATGVPGFAYANLAIRGRLFAPIVAEQVPVARELKPDLMSFAAGGNDALRRGFDPVRLTAGLDEVVTVLRADGADLLMFNFAPANLRLPGRNIFQSRARLLNPSVAEVAERHGARLVDLWSDGELSNPLFWSVDRLHLNPYGHRRVAGHALTALGIAPDPTWSDPPPSAPVPSWTASRVDDARWVGQHLAPWVRRRLTGRSSGDNRVPKRPTLGPLAD
ncbi:MAG: GDSL family lipase [Actinobacteria bacterium 13_2_20CM_2_71_6]|nr:MAG: GDSL family lipase [Actinobacteria bacterium 13_2_20CM_2_71_6]